jgi:hypothetical protein
MDLNEVLIKIWMNFFIVYYIIVLYKAVVALRGSSTNLVLDVIPNDH